MFRRPFFLGCVLIAAGIAWPALSIIHGLQRFADVYRTAAKQHRLVGVNQRSSVILAVENGITSIVGGVVVGLIGMTLALTQSESTSPDEESQADLPPPV